jgi:hypothetical protein
MGTWAEIRAGLKERLANIDGLVVHRAMPKTIADKDVAIVLYGDPLVAASGHGSKVNVGIRVVVRVTRGDLLDAQDAIDAYLWPVGPKSIVAAVNGDRTLGGKVDETQWQSSGSVGTLEDGSMQADINFLVTVAAA